MGITREQVASIGDLQPGEMKEARLGNSKVLLSRVGDSYYATSTLCTHYKAPLVKGTLSGDGRIMCPWHGACFSASTGDIEDAPGLDALASYKVIISGSKIIVEAEDSLLSANRRTPKVCKRDTAAQSRVVVLGGGAGGHVAVEVLRESGYSGQITLVSTEPYLPIDRPKLSKLLNPALDSILLRPQSYFNELGVDLLLGVSATSVDTTAKSVTLDNGTTLPYTHLILATGGNPRTLPIPGSELSEIHILRGLTDSSGIDASLTAIKSAKGAEYKPKMVIVGSSFIGMEMAAIAAKTCEVTVIGMEKVPFERVLGEKIGAVFRSMHEKAGVSFRMESVTDRFEPAGDGKAVGSVVLKSGESIPADLVVLGVGVVCATGFLKGSGIALERDGSVVVDSTMKVTDGVYAVGDIARYPYHITGDSVRVEHWSVAQNQARVAAQNIASLVSGGAGDTKFEHVPYFWSVQYGRSLRYAGHAHSFDDVIVRGDDLEEGFEAYYVKGDKVLAVASLARDPVVTRASELMRLGLMPSANEIRAGVELGKIKLGESPVSKKTTPLESEIFGIPVTTLIAGSAAIAAAAWFFARGARMHKA